MGWPPCCFVFFIPSFRQILDICGQITLLIISRNLKSKAQDVWKPGKRSLSTVFCPKLIPVTQALNINYGIGGTPDLGITTHGSDWYWAVTSVMGAATLVFMGLSFTRPRTERLFYYITASVTLVATIAYYSMGSSTQDAPPRVVRSTNFLKTLARYQSESNSHAGLLVQPTMLAAAAPGEPGRSSMHGTLTGKCPNAWCSLLI